MGDQRLGGHEVAVVVAREPLAIEERAAQDCVDCNAVKRQDRFLSRLPSPRQERTLMKKPVKKLGLHAETLRNLNGPCLLNVGGAAPTQMAQTICTSCTHVCSNCRPCL